MTVDMTAERLATPGHLDNPPADVGDNDYENSNGNSNPKSKGKSQPKLCMQCRKPFVGESLWCSRECLAAKQADIRAMLMKYRK